MYRFLLFDADDTILDFLRAEAIALEFAFEDVGIAYRDEYLGIYSNINKSLWKMLEKKEITKPELLKTRFQKFFEAAGLMGDTENIRTAYQMRLGEQGFLIKGAGEIIRDLSQKYDIYIITNGLKNTQMSRLSASGLMPYIKGVFISENIGAEKPAAEFFDAVERGICDFKKEEALVIGDSLSSDILGSNNAGIKTVWYNKDHAVNNSVARPDYEIYELAEIYDILI